MLSSKKAPGPCSTAFAYVVENHPSGASLPAVNCAALPLACPATAISVTSSVLANNAGGVGGIIVSPLANPVTGKIDPGIISLDSNGADDDGSGCGANNGVIDGDGGNSTIRADGAPFCHGEIGAGSGTGCGRIESYAIGPPACVLPACSTGGTVAPELTRVRQRITREKVDHKYNCKTSYPADYGIDGRYTSSSADYVDQIHAELGGSGTPNGYTRFSNSDCNVNRGKTLVIPSDNWHIRCSNLNVNGTLIIEGGNVVVDNNVRVAGELQFNINNFATEPATGSSIGTKYSNQRGMIYMRDGELGTSGSGSVRLHHTSVFLSETSKLDFGGGNGPLVWTAAAAGPFRGLALWSESDIESSFSGGAGLTLDGVFFVPKATIKYTSNGTSHQVQAQMIANRITAGGNGFFGLAPIYDQSVLFDAFVLPELIR